jgi:hypothetical protein
MPKKKTAQHKDAESDSAKEKKEGGPLERQRHFMRQRSAVLRPREDSSHKDANEESANEESAPEPSSSGPDKKPS